MAEKPESKKIIRLRPNNTTVAMHTDVKAVRKLMTHPAFTLKKQMQAALQKVAAAKGLSKDVQEVVGRSLGSESLG